MNILIHQSFDRTYTYIDSWATSRGNKHISLADTCNDQSRLIFEWNLEKHPNAKEAVVEWKKSWILL